MIKTIGIGLLCLFCSSLSVAADSSVIGSTVQTQLGPGSSDVQSTTYVYQFDIKSQLDDWSSSKSHCEAYGSNALTGSIVTLTPSSSSTPQKLPVGLYQISLQIDALQQKSGNAWIALGDVRVYTATSQANLIHLGGVKGFPYSTATAGFDCPYTSGAAPVASKIFPGVTYTYTLSAVGFNDSQTYPRIEIDVYDGAHSYAQINASGTVTFTSISGASSKILSPT